MIAIGAHVFAGGFTSGVMKVMPVLVQLETHGFGVETAAKRVGVTVLNAERWEDWPQHSCDLLFGNPRCTGFSCVTAGLGESAHGPWAKQTKDIHDMINYAMIVRPKVVVWESVQQAYSVGRPLLTRLADEVLAPYGYKVCHILLTAATFGNAQNRRRYFFVAYQDHLTFNVAPPDVAPYRTILRDVLEPLEHHETNRYHWRDKEQYDADSCFDLLPEEAEIVPLLEHGWDLNLLAKYRPEQLPPGMRKRWEKRGSDIPFSMHCVKRLAYDTFAPTLFGGCHNLVHPKFDRALTIRELSAIMGNDFTPVGLQPYAQIAKGVCPSVGTWLAQQAVHCINGDWDGDDFCSRYDAKQGVFIEGERKSEREKTFHLTDYRPYACRAYERWKEKMAWSTY
jgi:site-specific DNA-cytosine methylase